MKLEGYSDYEIYPEIGKIWSYKSNRFIGYKGTNGYIQCGIMSDNQQTLRDRLHRIIWMVVNGEIPEGMEINHIDENKENNCINNLVLMTHKENVNWGTGLERSKTKRKNNVNQSKPIIAIHNNAIKMFYPSFMETQRNGFSVGNICSCCNGKRKTAYGYKWQYLDDYLADWWEQEMEEYMENEKGVA